MNDKTGIIICARVKSLRLHEKTLQIIKGKKSFEILLDNLMDRHHFLDEFPIIVALPENEDDNPLEEIAVSKGIEVYRGQDDSPLHRTYECAKKYGFNQIVRITNDDILIDALLLKNHIKFHIQGGYDYTYMARCPEGIAGEVVKFSAIEKAVEKVGNKPIEFISYYVKTKEFKVKEYYPPPEYQFSFRLTMDYFEDLLLLRIIYLSLTEPFGTLDIINFLKSHKYLLQINRMPKITIYICNYNYSKYVLDCIKSIFEQDYDDYELIILDDCSTDDSMNKIVEFVEHDVKIKILRNKENMGLPASCNKVLEMARGKYIMRVDADDLLKQGILKKMVEEMETSRDVSGIISGYDTIDENGKMIEVVKENNWHPGCCLLDRRAVNEIKFKNGIKYFEGAEFWERFKNLYNVEFIPESFWCYRRHSQQKSDESNREERQHGRLRPSTRSSGSQGPG